MLKRKAETAVDSKAFTEKTKEWMASAIDETSFEKHQSRVLPKLAKPGDLEDSKASAPWSSLRNRLGWRYEWARAQGEEEHYVDITLPYSPLGFSTTDRSRMIALSHDLQTASAPKGYCSARGRFGVRSGSWYYEVLVDKAAGATNEGGPHVRLGWSRREACLEAPVGYDSYSYAYRDSGGEKVHESFREAYGDTFSSGDVIGVYISLPISDEAFYTATAKQAAESAQHTSLRADGAPVETPPGALFDHQFPPRSCCAAKRERLLIQYKGDYFYESHEYNAINSQPVITTEAQYALSHAVESQSVCESPRKKKQAPHGLGHGGVQTAYDAAIDVKELLPEVTSSQFPVVANSKVVFFKNGRPQGVAFRNLPVPFSAALLLPQDKRLAKEQLHRKALQRTEMSVYQNIPLLPIHDDGTLGYYPAVSCYNGGQVSLNLGPTFKHTPDKDAIGIQGRDWQPLCLRYLEREVENLVCDIIDIVCEDA